MTSISVVIPAWNEEEGIEKTINNIPRLDLEMLGYTLQVIVVDGNSNDRTVELAKKAGAEVVVEARPGYGRAYKTGFAAAKGKFIVTVDADNTYPVRDIPKLLQLLENERLDFITTDRLALMERGAMSFRNKVGNKILALEINLLFHLKMKDPESGMWVFKQDILETFNLKKDDNTFSHEIKLEACYFNKYAWMEVPINYKNRAQGNAKLTNGWKGWKAGFANVFHILYMRLAR